MSHERKRAHSRAAEPPSKRMRNPPNQAVESFAALATETARPPIFTSSTALSFNKENELPMYSDTGIVLNAFLMKCIEQLKNDASIALPLRASSHVPPLQDLLRNGYTDYQVPKQILNNKPVLDCSPPDLDPYSSSPSADVSGVYFAPDPGTTIYEDPITNLSITSSDQLVHTGSPTPSGLNFQELSLLDWPHTPLSAPMSRRVEYINRASLFVLPTVVFAGSFPTITPNDTVIFFDRGKQFIKTDKYPLCNASRFFAKILDGPLLGSYTRCIRLRDDFPYGIKAMIHFINTGTYTFDPEMCEQHPNITMLDLHIHAYLVGSKYDVDQLRDHAIDEYTALITLILSVSVGFSHTPSHPAAQAQASFLDSLVLLWKTTPTAHDPLRAAALDIIKTSLNSLLQLPFFATLMTHMPAFGNDVVRSLAEDGFDVKAYALPADMGLRERRSVMFRRVL